MSSFSGQVLSCDIQQNNTKAEENCERRIIRQAFKKKRGKNLIHELRKLTDGLTMQESLEQNEVMSLIQQNLILKQLEAEGLIK